MHLPSRSYPALGDIALGLVELVLDGDDLLLHGFVLRDQVFSFVAFVDQIAKDVDRHVFVFDVERLQKHAFVGPRAERVVFEPRLLVRFRGDGDLPFAGNLYCQRFCQSCHAHTASPLPSAWCLAPVYHA